MKVFLIPFAIFSLISCGAVPVSQPKISSSSIQSTLSSTTNISSSSLNLPQSSSSSYKNLLEVNSSKPWVVGSYMYSSKNTLPLDSVPWDKLTMLRYAFALPTQEGIANIPDTNTLRELVSLAHSKNKFAGLGVGGAAGGESFATLSSNDSLMNQFIVDLVDKSKKYEVDVLVIDWEHWPTGGTQDTLLENALTRLMCGLYPFLLEEGILLGMDVFGGDWYGKHFLNSAFACSDFANIMTMDDAGSWSTARPHSPVSLIESSSNYYINRLGEEWRNKLSITIPFYGYEFDSDYVQGDPTKCRAVRYNTLVDEYPQAAFHDTVTTATGTAYHQSLQSIATKISEVKRLGLLGVVNWEESFDIQENGLSLQDSIWNSVYP